MNLPPALHKALLAGVARAPVSADSAGAALQDVLFRVPEPTRLWHTVAASDLWQRAGLQLSQADQPTPCPDGPTCPSAAEQMLQLILRGIHAEQLDSWLALARIHRMSLPHNALATLLERGSDKPALRATLMPLLGQRGQWLVAQHPEWSEQYGSVTEAPEMRWQTGSLSQRRDALTAMRRSGPAAALAALKTEWPQETPENRAALLTCLATGLNPRDEAFLERALDDKRKEVRAEAQQLLAGLPGSQLTERCEARLTALVTLERKSGLAARLTSMLGGAGLPELKLELPQACDASMKRDGVGAEKHRGLGEKAGWLLDLMRCVPPSHWSASWQLMPRQVLDVMLKNEFGDALITGLVQAAARELDGEWFVMLMTEGALAVSSVNILAMLLPEMHRLPQQEQERIVLRWMAQSNDAPTLFTYALEWAEQRFSSTGSTSSPALSRLMLSSAQRQIGAATLPDYVMRRHIGVLAKVLDTTVIDAVQTGWPRDDWANWPQWRQPIDDLKETLQFRHTMQASFLETDA